MATALKPIAHDDRLSIVDHLDELRSRLIVSIAALVIAFAFCFWQNSELLRIINKPVRDSTPTVQHHSGNGRLDQAAAAQATVRNGFTAIDQALSAIAKDPAVSPQTKQALATAAPKVKQAADALPKTNPPRLPITTGVAEPFTATITVAAYAALLLALPVILYQLYAFILPAFSPRERKVALPLMLLVPALFITGVVFAYLLVLPPAVSFLQNFNNANFDVLLQARDYYRFAIMSLLACGLIFQLPVGLLALDVAGIITAKTLIRGWRYAIVLIAVVAAVMPGVDPVSTLLLMVPMLLLYGLSIVLLTIADRRRGSHDEEVVVPASFDDDGI